MKYLVLISTLFLANCGADCETQKECVKQFNEEYPEARDKAISDTEAEWDRFDDKWTAEKNRLEQQVEDSETWDEEFAEGGVYEPPFVESDGTLKPGLTQEQVLEIYGEPDSWSERLGSGGEIWKYSEICKDTTKICAIYFDEYYRVEHQSNIL